MSDGSVTIGRVSVKVMPDTEDFYRLAKTAIEAAEKKLGDIEVDIHVDADGLAVEANAAVEATQKKLKSLTLHFDPDGSDSLKRAIKEVDRELEKLREIDLKVELDEESLEAARELLTEQLDKQKLEFEVEPNKASLERTMAQIDKMLGRDGTFHFSVDTDTESLLELRQHLEELKDDFDNTELDFEPVIDGVNAAATTLRLAHMARDRWVVFHPVIDSIAARKVATALASLSGARLLSSTFENLWDLVKNLDKNIPLIGSITLAVMGLSAWLLAAASNTFTLSRSLAQIGGVMLTLPGILGGFAFGVGALVAILKDWNSVLPEIWGSLRELQDGMSARFYTQAASSIEEAWVERLLPALTDGLLGTSDALATWTIAMVNALGGQLPSSMPTMFANLNNSIRIAALGADDFAQALEILGRRGSEYLPRLATWWNRVQRNFAGWLDEKDRAGELNDFIDLAIYQAGQLGEVLRHTGGILADLARAAEKAGGSTLTTLSDKLENIRDVTSGRKFQEGMVTTLRASHDAMDRIANVSGPRVSDFFENLADIFERGMPNVGDALGELVGGIAEALSTDNFEEGFIDFLRGVREGVQDLTPVWSDLGDGIGAVLELAGEIARSFGPLLAEALRLAAEAAERLGPSLQRVVEALSGRLLAILESVGPLLITMADSFVRMIEPLTRIPGLIEAVILAFAGWKLAVITTELANLGIKLGVITTMADGRTITGISKLGKALGGAAVALAAYAGAAALAEESGSKSIASVETERLAEALEAVRRNGDKSYEVINDLFTVHTPGNLGEREVSSLTDALGEFYQTARVLYSDDFMQKVTRPFVAPANRGKMDEWFRNLDAAMADLVNNGNIEAARDTYGQFATQFLRAGGSMEEFTSQLPNYNQALDENEQAAREMVRETELLNGAMLGLPEGTMVASKNVALYEQALASVNGVTPQVIESIREASKAFIDFSQGLDPEEYNFSGWIEGLQAQVDAANSWADNMSRLALDERVTQPMIDMFNELGPAGAQALEDLLSSNSPEAWATVAEAARLGAEGVTGAVDSEFAKMETAVQTALQLAALAASGELDNIEQLMLVGGQAGTGAFGRGLGFTTPVNVGAALIRSALAGDLSALEQLGTPAGQELIRQLAAGMGIELPTVETAAAGAAASAKEALNLEVPNVGEVGSRYIDTFAGGMRNNGAAGAAGEETGTKAGSGVIAGLNAQQTAVKQAAASMAKAMSAAWSNIQTNGSRAGDAAGAGFVRGLMSHLKSAATVGLNMSTLTVRGMAAGASPALRAGLLVGSGYARGVGSTQGLSRAAGAAVAGAAVRGMHGYSSLAYGAGLNTGSGYASGVRAMTGAAAAAGASLGAAANAGLQRTLDINSPSRVWRDFGQMTGEGFVLGLEDMAREAELAGARLGEAASRGAVVPMRPTGVMSSLAARDSGPQEVTGRFALDEDGWVRLIDGRIVRKDNENMRDLRGRR